MPWGLWIAIASIALTGFVAACIRPLLRKADYSGIVPELRQSASESNPVNVQTAAASPPAEFCPICWGTGRALMPHSDQSWMFCGCKVGAGLRTAFEERSK